MPRHRAAPALLLALATAHLCIDMTQGAIPALGSYMENFHQWSYTRVGSLALVISLASVALQPLGGAYGDRSRNGLLMPIGLLLVSGGLLVAALSSPGAYSVILFGVILVGIGVAVFHPDAMRAAYFAIGRRRATGMALFQAGGNFGIALGPATAAFGMAKFGLRGLMLAAIPPLLWFGLLLRLLPALRRLWTSEPADDQAQRPPVVEQDQWGAQARIMGVVALRAMFQMTVLTFLPIYVTGVLGGSHTEGNLLTSLYLLGGAGGTLLGGPLADRIGLRPYLTGALALIGPIHWGTLAAPSAWKPALLVVQGGLLISTMTVSMIFSQRYAPNHLALVSGLNAGANIGLGGLGAALAGLAADMWGLLPVLTVVAVLPILSSLLSLTLPPAPELGKVVVQYGEPEGGG